MPEGYCTLADLRRALRKKELPGDVAQDVTIASSKVASQSEWLEKTIGRHWYASSGDDVLDDADTVTIPQSPKTRDDEHDLPTQGASAFGASERERHRYSANSDALLESGPRYERRRRELRSPKRELRLAFGRPGALDPPVDETVPAYTKLTFNRRDVDAVNELHVVNADGGFDDWVSDPDYDGGVGNTHRGGDYWVRVNNRGVSELYLDVHAMDDDLPSVSKAVYVDFDYGHEGIPRPIRNAVAFRAAAQLIDEPSVQIPDNVQVLSAETLAERMKADAEELLEAYR